MYENMKIWKYTNIHVEKYKCGKRKRVCKEIIYIYINQNVTSNRNVNKETNKRNKKNKYIKITNT